MTFVNKQKLTDINPFSYISGGCWFTWLILLLQHISDHLTGNIYWTFPGGG